MTFKLQIIIDKPEPSFDEMVPENTIARSESERALLIAEKRNEWRLDQLSDFADVLRLAGNRIMRGEKSGKVRDLTGNNVGEFWVEL